MYGLILQMVRSNIWLVCNSGCDLIHVVRIETHDTHEIFSALPLMALQLAHVDSKTFRS